MTNPDEPPTPGQLGVAPNYHWQATPELVDMAMPQPAPRPVDIEAAPQNVRVDLNRTAIVIHDYDTAAFPADIVDGRE